MAVANPKLLDLDNDAREVLESMLVEFDLSWTVDSLASRMRELPPPSPLRLPALVEMMKIDMERQWQRGRLMTVETYLSTYPELGTPDTVPADLIQAEYEVRRQFGRPVEFSELARRFPRQAEQVRRLVEQARQGTSTSELPRAETVSFHEGSTLPPAGPAVHVATTQPPTGAATSSEPPGRPATAAPGTDWSIGQIPEKFGRYRIVKCLGQGGMGAVYLAHDTQLDRQVAIKVPHFERDAEAEVLERFYRESRAAATLDHPNICPVHDVGEIDGVQYLVMAYIEGKPLSDFVRKDKPIPLRQVAAIVRKLALALQEAHSHGVVHRDLKPANIMANKRRELVIMDFGLARLTKKSSEGESRLTQSGVVMGTPSLKQFASSRWLRRSRTDTPRWPIWLKRSGII